MTDLLCSDAEGKSPTARVVLQSRSLPRDAVFGHSAKLRLRHHDEGNGVLTVRALDGRAGGLSCWGLRGGVLQLDLFLARGRPPLLQLRGQVSRPGLDADAALQAGVQNVLGAWRVACGFGPAGRPQAHLLAYAVALQAPRSLGAVEERCGRAHGSRVMGRGTSHGPTGKRRALSRNQLRIACRLDRPVLKRSRTEFMTLILDRRFSASSLNPSLRMPAGRPNMPTARMAAAPPTILPSQVAGEMSPYPTVVSVAL